MFVLFQICVPQPFLLRMQKSENSDAGPQKHQRARSTFFPSSYRFSTVSRANLNSISKWVCFSTMPLKLPGSLAHVNRFYSNVISGLRHVCEMPFPKWHSAATARRNWYRTDVRNNLPPTDRIRHKCRRWTRCRLREAIFSSFFYGYLSTLAGATKSRVKVVRVTQQH